MEELVGAIRQGKGEMDMMAAAVVEDEGVVMMGEEVVVEEEEMEKCGLWRQ